MAYTTFAAIDVGSNDVCMKIYQISASKGIKEIDYVSRYLAIGRDTYRYGKISNAIVDELSQVLNRFKKKMKEYQASALEKIDVVKGECRDSLVEMLRYVAERDK